MQVEHGCRHFREVFKYLDPRQVVFHLFIGQLDQILHGNDFGLQLFDHSFEWLRTVLAIVRQSKNLALETLAHASYFLMDVHTFLIDQDIDRFGLDIAIEVLELEALVVEASEHFTP